VKKNPRVGKFRRLVGWGWLRNHIPTKFGASDLGSVYIYRTQLTSFLEGWHSILWVNSSKISIISLGMFRLCYVASWGQVTWTCAAMVQKSGHHHLAYYRALPNSLPSRIDGWKLEDEYFPFQHGPFFGEMLNFRCRISSGFRMICLQISFFQRFFGKGKGRVPFKDYWAQGCRLNWALLVSSPNWQETIWIYFFVLPYASGRGLVLIVYLYAYMPTWEERKQKSPRV